MSTIVRSRPYCCRMILAIIAATAPLPGCGAAPTGSTPTMPSAPPQPANGSTTGFVRDALSDAPVTAARIAGDGIGSSTADLDGTFTVASIVAGGVFTASVTGTEYVPHVTNIRIPGPSALVTLIPVTFDLAAFDEMMRSNSMVLQRWIDSPPLKLQKSVLQFTDLLAEQFTATTEVLSEDETIGLREDLLWALPQMTGGQFTTFGNSTVEASQPGGRVAVLQSGVITVARYLGLEAQTGFTGYTRWQFEPSGRVVGASIMLDRAFDRNSTRAILRALRAHELGHALGYNHVSRRTSVMNAGIYVEPTAFDRQATSIAFKRPPGNRAPDSDPASFSLNLIHTGLPIWSVGMR
jgi:Matrixin